MVIPMTRSPFQLSAPTASGVPGASGSSGPAQTMRAHTMCSCQSGPGMLDTIAVKNRRP